jgi:Thioesterase-like superfamily
MAAPDVDDPLFSRDGNGWQPHPEAAGPFRGLHGGAVSGLIVAEMERRAREDGLGLVLSASVLLLRPAPAAAFELRTELLRKGGRSSALETTLMAEGRLIAKGTASCVAPQRATGTPAEPPRPVDAGALPPWPLKPRFAQRTLFDALDLRIDAEGAKWGRLMRPLVPYDAALALAFAVADNGQPFSLTEPGELLQRYTFPNIDIAIHAARPPVGEWIGVKARSDWRPEGMGLTESELYDVQGRFGRACQTVVLVPHE